MDHRRWNQPQNEAERSALLNTLFPFAVEQDQLRQDFRTNIAECSGSDGAKPVQQVRVRQVSSPLQNDGATQSTGGGGGGSGNPAE